MQAKGDFPQHGMIYEITVQKVQPDQEMARVVEWLKEEGDYVNQGDRLLVMETHKATVALEAEVSGVIEKIRVAAGQWVAVPAIVGEITIC